MGEQQSADGIRDALALIRGVGRRDEATLEVIGTLDLLEARQMVGRLAHLVLAARTVAPGAELEQWCERIAETLDDSPS